MAKKKEARKGLRDYNSFELLSKRFRSLPDKFDVIHLHDMSTVFSPGAIAWLSKRVTTVWTIHDCSPFTAGCLYPGNCIGYKRTCGNCPQHFSWPISSNHDRTTELHERRKLLRDSNLHFTAPSHWMIGMYEDAGWPIKKISYVPNGVNLAIFKPNDRKKLREKYEIKPSSGPLLLFSAGWLHDDRKGPHEVVQFFKGLASLNPKLILVGRYSDDADKLFRALDCEHFGFVKSGEERSEIFSMCDATLLFSKEENAPLIALESLSVGTPIFGFNSGGIGEIVVNGITGFVGSRLEMPQIISEVDKLLSQSDQSQTHTFCRERAETNYGDAAVAQLYIELFEDLKRKEILR